MTRKQLDSGNRILSQLRILICYRDSEGNVLTGVPLIDVECPRTLQAFKQELNEMIDQLEKELLAL